MVRERSGGGERLHHLLGVRSAGKKVVIPRPRGGLSRFVCTEKIHLAGSFEELLPGHRRFQLVTSRRGRPAWLISQRLFRGQSEDRMDCVAPLEILQHRSPRGNGRVLKFRLFRYAPGSQKSADDYAAIEKICQRPRSVAIHGMLERERLQSCVPACACQKSRCLEGRVQIVRLSSAPMKKEQRADCIAGDLTC